MIFPKAPKPTASTISRPPMGLSNTNSNSTSNSMTKPMTMGVQQRTNMAITNTSSNSGTARNTMGLTKPAVRSSSLVKGKTPVQEQKPEPMGFTQKPSTKYTSIKTVDLFAKSTNQNSNSFAYVYNAGGIPCRVNHGSVHMYIQWNKDVDLKNLPYDPLLATCFEGLVEEKHPYNFIAYNCIKEMLEEETAGDKIIPMISKLAWPLRNGLQHANDKNFENSLNILKQLSDQIGPNLNPHIKNLLQPIVKKMNKPQEDYAGAGAGAEAGGAAPSSDYAYDQVGDNDEEEKQTYDPHDSDNDYYGNNKNGVIEDSANKDEESSSAAVPSKNEDEKEEEEEVEDDDEEDETPIDEDENLKQQTQEQTEKIESLKAEVLEFKELWEKFEADFDKSTTNEYFLVSIKWMKAWKKYVSYDRVVKGLVPDFSTFALNKTALENANENLIKFNTRENISYYKSTGDSQFGASIVLKKKIRNGLHYTIIDNDIVTFFAAAYEGFSIISRYAHISPSGRKIVDAQYKQVLFKEFLIFLIQERGRVNLTILNIQTLKNIDLSSLKHLTSKKVQICTSWTQGELKEFLAPFAGENQISTDSYYNVPSITDASCIRLWRLGEKDTLITLFNQLYSATRSFTSFDYRFKCRIPLLERPDDSSTVEQLKVEEDMTIIVEIRKPNSTSWFFKLEGEPEEEQCEYCRNYKVLKVECKCKLAKYCSEECRFKDTDYHSRNCDFAGDTGDEPKEFVEGSVRGVCGFQNIGNTCFMNSALQCLSNTEALTKYFLDGTFELEINEQNPLGQKGNIANNYGKFIRRTWMGTSSVINPQSLKNAIGKAQSMFADYSQHDSQEFLQYILDELHEDLNRVKNKKPTESIDSNGRDDAVVSKESWANTMLRDQSIIVDLMKGQYKSKVQCPTCDRQSITFDPFLSVSLPIPNTKQKEIRAYLIYSNNRKTAIDIRYSYDPVTKIKVKDFKEYCAEKYDSNAAHLELLHLTFNNQREIFYDDMLLEDFRKNMKLSLKNTLLIEHDFDVNTGTGEVDLKEIQEDAEIKNRVRVPVQFTKMKEFSSYYNSSNPTKESITFIRPFLFPKNSTAEDVRVAVFKYLLPIFKRDFTSNEDFNNDCETLSFEEMYEKYYTKSEEMPYILKFNTDYQEYNKRPCSYCKTDGCKDCVLPESFDTSLEEIVSASPSSYHSFKILCIVNKNSSFGYLMQGLNTLDETISKSKKTQQQTDEPILKTTLQDCLDLFQEPEKLVDDNLWYCNVCKEHKEALKQLQIYSAPEILVLQMKRFKGSGGLFKAKLTKLVDFPIEGLDLTDYVISKEKPSSSEFPSYIEPQVPTNPCNMDSTQQETNEAAATPEQNDDAKESPEGRILYDLYGVINHFGSLGFGHYTAFAKNKGKWYDFDDSSVSPINPERVVSEASYILFYKRRN